MRLVITPHSAARNTPAARSRWLTLLRGHQAFVLAGCLGLLFLAAPWPLADKLRVVLHGLCAQRLSHTYHLGGLALPFDARMTGIYGGFLLTFVLLLCLGRGRAWGDLSRPVLAVLLGFVAVMGIDGVNSTLRDLGFWHPYVPRNDLRVVTGSLAGIALAVLMTFLLATTLWRSGDRRTAVIRRPRELAVPVLIQIPFWLAVWSGFGMLYAPLSLLLLASAATALTAMAVASLAIVTRRELSFHSASETQPLLAAAMLLSVTTILLLAGGRFALETWLAIPPLG